MLNNQIRMPLQVVFMWHPRDTSIAEPIADYCFAMLSRNESAPFSYAINLPVFFLRSLGKEYPREFPFDTDKTLLFLFCSKNLVADKEWVSNIEDNLLKESTVTVIPIALDSYAFNLPESLSERNFIRAYEFTGLMQKDWLFISVAHEIIRRGFANAASDSTGDVTIFLSHRKADEKRKRVAETIKKFIDTKTTLKEFFDTTDILPAEKFDDKIRSGIEDSVFLAIKSDGYAASYWCQKEIITAKKESIPMLILDVLENGEDRSFPYLANVPTVRTSLPLQDDNILYILSRLLLEKLRFSYSRSLFETVSKWNSMDNNNFTERVPELIYKKNNNHVHYDKDPNVIYYHGPNVYPDERDILLSNGIEAHPLREMGVTVENKSVGLSISEPSEEDLYNFGIKSTHLKLLSQDFVLYFLARNMKLVYGGDLRKDGFTEFLLEEATIVQERSKEKGQYIENYMAWPIYLKNDEEFITWVSKYNKVASVVQVPPPADVEGCIPGTDQFLSPSNISNRYVWGRCLTEMRSRMVKKCDARVHVGGKKEGYKGRMPGILEEVILAIQHKKPIFLLGGYGGITHSICELIQNGKLPDELTYDWQAMHNGGYADLKEYYEKEDAEFTDYAGYEKIINFYSLNNGLTKEENITLFKSKYTEEIFYLIYKGLDNLYNK